MALEIIYSPQFVDSFEAILNYFDERNGSDTYSRRLLRCLLEDLQRLSQSPTASSPSTRPDLRFFYLMGFTIIFRYNTRKLTVLSIRSSVRKPLKLYQPK